MKLRLSPLMQEIVDVIGLAATVRLIDARGGQRIWLPLSIEPDFWLAQLIGIDKTKKLAAYFNYETGSKIDLPSTLRLDMAEKERVFRTMVKEGRSANKIAAANGVSRRWVFEKKKKLQIKPPQSDLFDC